MQYDKNHPNTIQKMFGSIANSYDRTNAILSFQLHRYWNKTLIDKVIRPTQPKVLLDLCCGTGEIALAYLKKAEQPCHAHLLDFCPEMLQCAKNKAAQLPAIEQHSMTYLQADAQALPLSDQTVTCATVAYGIRNIKDPKQCLSEVYRVLQPGAIFGILELTRPTNRFLRLGHHLYLRTLLPILGYYFSANEDAYRYLCNSIHTFVKPGDLHTMMNQIGFKEIQILPLSGGIATILIAKKPR